MTRTFTEEHRYLKGSWRQFF